jgi:hypothetical protein
MVGLADAFILPGLDAAQGSPFDWLSVARVKAFRDVVALVRGSLSWYTKVPFLKHMSFVGPCTSSCGHGSYAPGIV